MRPRIAIYVAPIACLLMSASRPMLAQRAAAPAAQSASATTARIVAAAQALVATLDDAARAKVQFPFDDPVRYVTEFAATIPKASPSLRLDLLARRRSEIDVINGQVVELSRELGVDAPYNETLCAIVRERESHFEP